MLRQAVNNTHNAHDGIASYYQYTNLTVVCLCGRYIRQPTDSPAAALAAD